MSFSVPILAGLARLVVGYVLSLVMIYVLSLIANALAPTFKGEKNPLGREPCPQTAQSPSCGFRF